MESIRHLTYPGGRRILRMIFPAGGSLPQLLSVPGSDSPDVRDETVPGVPETDESLLLRAGGGDHTAFGELVARYERWARTHALRIVGDEHEAEDLVQEAFLRLWRSAPRWRPESSARAYLKVILNHVCVDHLRKNRPDPVESVEDRPDTSPGPLQIAAARQSAERLSILIVDLPPTQRMAVYLVYGEGLRYAEAAASMRMGVKAFESLLHRARTRLRKAWHDHET